MKVTIIPIVIGAFSTVTKGLLKGLEDLEVGGRGKNIQTTALLRTTRILRRVPETWGDLLSLKLQKNSQRVNNNNDNNNNNLRRLAVSQIQVRDHKSKKRQLSRIFSKTKKAVEHEWEYHIRIEHESEYHLYLWTWLNSVQMRTPTGSRWMSNNYITRCHRLIEWVAVSSSQLVSSVLVAVGVSWGQDAELREGLGPQWPTVEQPNEDGKEVILWSEEHWVNMLQFVPVSNSPLTHNQHQPFRTKWEVYFYQEACSFIHWSRTLLLTMFLLLLVYVYEYV